MLQLEWNVVFKVVRYRWAALCAATLLQVHTQELLDHVNYITNVYTYH